MLAETLKWLLAGCFAAFMGAVSALELNQLRYITEHSPPHNYVEEGVLKGPAVELLLAATRHAGSPVERSAIQVQPWARAWRNALEGPNTVLFNTIRTPDREAYFKWAGPTGSEKYVLIANKERAIKVNHKRDLLRYRIGAIRDDIGETYLRDLKVNPARLMLATGVENLSKMLKAGRIDLWIFGEDGWRQSLAALEIDASNYEAVYVIKQNDYYFAFSKDVDDDLVQAMQQALDAVQGGGNH